MRGKVAAAACLHLDSARPRSVTLDSTVTRACYNSPWPSCSLYRRELYTAIRGFHLEPQTVVVTLRWDTGWQAPLTPVV
jgi:hypothetical protein